MVNVFSQMQPPAQQGAGGGADDVAQALAQMMAQQQANEPNPRPPTPEEAAQLKQAGLQMLQAKGVMPKQAQQAPDPSQVMAQAPQGPPPPSTGGGMPPMDGLPPGLASSVMNSPQNSMGRLTGNDPNYPWKDNTLTTPAPKSYEQLGVLGHHEDSLKKLDEIKKGLIDYYDSYGNRFDVSPMAGLNRVNTKDMMGRDPVDFFRTEAPKMMAEIGKDHPELNAKYQEAKQIIAGMQPSAQPGSMSPDQQQASKKIAALPDAYTPDEKESLLGTDKSKAQGPQAPAGSEDDERASLQPMEKGSPEHLDHLAKNVAPEARKVADAIVAGGADTPEKAEIVLRSKFAGDPELDKAIEEAKATYDQVRTMNNTPPTVTQFIGAILLGLVGAHPDVIANILHPNAHLNAMREQQSGESLLKLQLAKAHGLQQDRLTQAKQGEDSMAQKRLDQQMSIFHEREGDVTKHQNSMETRQALEKARDNASSMARHFADLASKSVGNEKKKNLDLAEQYRQHSEMFGQMLGEPTLQQGRQMGQPKPPQGKPTSMAPSTPPGQVSPSAMRLLGMSA